MSVGLLYHMDTDFVKTFSASAALASQRPDLPTRLAKNSGITSTYDVAVGRIERNRATYVRETLEGCGEFLCRPPGVHTRLAAIDHVHWRCGARADLF